MRCLAPVVESITKKFDAVQVHSPVADGSTNSNGIFCSLRWELKIDLSSDRQVGKSEQADAPFTQPNAAAINGTVGSVDDHAHGGVKRMALPTAAVDFRQHSFFQTKPHFVGAQPRSARDPVLSNLISGVLPDESYGGTSVGEPE